MVSGFRRIVLVGSLVLATGCTASVSIGGDDRQERVENLVATLIEKNIADQGATITVTSTDCTDVGDAGGDVTIDCRLTIEESSETVPVTAEITIDGDNITGTAVTNAGLLTKQAGVNYAQGLVNNVSQGVTVNACDLTDTITVVEPGDTFSCTTDSNETVTITIQPDGTGQITNVE